MINEFMHILFFKFYELLHSKYYTLVNNYYGNKLTNETKQKLVINYVSVTHTSLITPLFLIYYFYPNYYLLQFNKLYSSHYFIHDIQFILLNKYNKLSGMDCFYLFHHLIAVINIYNIKMYDLHSKIVCISLFWLEVSNIPYFIVYHLLKTNGSKKLIQQVKNYQKYHYSFIRVFIVGYCIYRYYITQNNKIMNFLAITLYLSGVFFSCVSFIKNNKTEIVNIKNI